MAKVSSFGGADRTSFLSAAPIRPLDSASPMPSIETNTVPSGAKLVKLVTIRVSIRWRPSTFIRLITSIVSPVDGWLTDRLKLAKIPEKNDDGEREDRKKAGGMGEEIAHPLDDVEKTIEIARWRSHWP